MSCNQSRSRARNSSRYLKDAHSQVRLFDTTGKPSGEIATCRHRHGRARRSPAERQPNLLFLHQLSRRADDLSLRRPRRRKHRLRKPEVDFAADRYVTEQVFYDSKDGTRVPMFITRRRDLPLDGNNPTYLFAYGGFDISLTPSFSPGRLVWLELGGIYAQPNLAAAANTAAPGTKPA